MIRLEDQIFKSNLLNKIPNDFEFDSNPLPKYKYTFTLKTTLDNVSYCLFKVENIIKSELNLEGNTVIITGDATFYKWIKTDKYNYLQDSDNVHGECLKYSNYFNFNINFGTEYDIYKESIV